MKKKLKNKVFEKFKNIFQLDSSPSSLLHLMSYAAALTQTTQTTEPKSIMILVPETHKTLSELQAILEGVQESVQATNTKIAELEESAKKKLEKASKLEEDAKKDLEIADRLREEKKDVLNCLTFVNKQSALAICENSTKVKEEVKETKTVKAPPKVGLPKVQQKTKKQSVVKGLFCNFCKEEGHSLFKCTKLPICNDCGRKGHNADSCHGSCRNCGLPNHATANCFAPKK